MGWDECRSRIGRIGHKTWFSLGGGLTSLNVFEPTVHWHLGMYRSYWSFRHHCHQLWATRVSHPYPQDHGYRLMSSSQSTHEPRWSCTNSWASGLPLSRAVLLSSLLTIIAVYAQSHGGMQGVRTCGMIDLYYWPASSRGTMHSPTLHVPWGARGSLTYQAS